MLCPICKIQLDRAVLSGVEVNYCPSCLGLWFEEDELRWAKDYKDRNLRWLDIDLWKDETKFRISPGKKLCPRDRFPLYETAYGDSGIHPVKSAKGGARPVKSEELFNRGKQFNGVKVDVCNLCHGIWLDRGEFKKIIQYLREKADQEILNHYLKNLRSEFWEIFAGPETLKEEIEDFLIVLKLLNYKLAVQHPAIARIIASLPK
jgi:Zn-finger nucleic acid-binding protein